MSVGALIVPSLAVPPDQPAPGYLPVASETEFAQYWLPLASSAGLEVVRGFQPGVALKPHQLPTALTELDQLHTLITDAALEPAISERLLDRVTRLRQLLSAVDENEVEEVFIG